MAWDWTDPSAVVLEEATRVEGCAPNASYCELQFDHMPSTSQLNTTLTISSPVNNLTASPR
eukprot:4949641-Prymnesium_polylepis.1